MEERRTILYVLTEVMLADEILHPAEQKFFNRMFDAINADVSDMIAMEHIDNDYALAVFKGLTADKQCYLKYILHEMAMADGWIDPREQKVLDFYS